MLWFAFDFVKNNGNFPERSDAHEGEVEPETSIASVDGENSEDHYCTETKGAPTAHLTDEV